MEGEGEGEGEQVTYAVRVIKDNVITLHVTPPDAQGWGVGEIVPKDLEVQNIVGRNVSYDQKIRWIYWYSFDIAPVTLSYTLTGPDGAYRINGNVAINTMSNHFEITGDSTLFIGSVEVKT